MLCAVDHAALGQRLGPFTIVFYFYSLYSSDEFIYRLPARSIRRSRPCTRTESRLVAQNLALGRPRGLCPALCMVFGTTGRVISAFLHFSRLRLLRTLSL